MCCRQTLPGVCGSVSNGLTNQNKKSQPSWRDERRSHLPSSKASKSLDTWKQSSDSRQKIKQLTSTLFIESWGLQLESVLQHQAYQTTSHELHDQTLQYITELKSLQKDAACFSCSHNSLLIEIWRLKINLNFHNQSFYFSCSISWFLWVPIYLFYLVVDWKNKLFKTCHLDFIDKDQLRESRN